MEYPDRRRCSQISLRHNQVPLGPRKERQTCLSDLVARSYGARTVEAEEKPEEILFNTAATIAGRVDVTDVTDTAATYVPPGSKKNPEKPLLNTATTTAGKAALADKRRRTQCPKC